MLIFQVSKNYRKKSKIAKNNRKRTAIISYQKILMFEKKNRIHWSRSLSHRIIALSFRNKYRKMSSMRLPSLILTSMQYTLKQNSNKLLQIVHLTIEFIFKISH